MAEIIFRYPSKIPYGYVEVKLDGEISTPALLAEEYVRNFKEFKEAEEAALAAPTVKREPTEEEAKRIVESVLGDTTEVSDSDGAAPWDQEAPAPAAKPWGGDWDI